MIKNSHLSRELKHKNRFGNFRNMITLLTYLEAFSHWVRLRFLRWTKKGVLSQKLLKLNKSWWLFKCNSLKS